jgi:hypothetical protein
MPDVLIGAWKALCVGWGGSSRAFSAWVRGGFGGVLRLRFWLLSRSAPGGRSGRC